MRTDRSSEGGVQKPKTESPQRRRDRKPAVTHRPARNKEGFARDERADWVALPGGRGLRACPRLDAPAPRRRPRAAARELEAETAARGWTRPSPETPTSLPAGRGGGTRRRDTAAGRGDGGGARRSLAVMICHRQRRLGWAASATAPSGGGRPCGRPRARRHWLLGERPAGGGGATLGRGVAEVVTAPGDGDVGKLTRLDLNCVLGYRLAPSRQTSKLEEI
nr:uncharacterized protein LOC101789300 [Cavia porcellus]